MPDITVIEASPEVEHVEAAAETAETVAEASVEIAQIAADRDVAIAEIQAETQEAAIEAAAEAAEAAEEENESDLEEGIEQCRQNIESLSQTLGTVTAELSLIRERLEKPSHQPSPEPDESAEAVRPEVEAEPAPVTPQKPVKKLLWI